MAVRANKNSKKSHHVIPDPDGGWSVKKGGSLRVTRRFDNKAEAIKWGREVSKNQRTEFVIHKRDGTIERKDSHRQDPSATTG